MKQWHPIFVQLLRPAVESHYEVQTTVPVGDAPREADIVLLRRTSSDPLPFRGLWRNLTIWNVFEFKGPTVSPRLRDLDALVELGLGIDRRLNDERIQQGHRPLLPQDVSFWLLGNRLGRRFLRDARERLGSLQQVGDGIWRCELLQRMVFLVSSVHLAIEEDSLPLHLIGQEPLETELAVARFVVSDSARYERFGSWLAYLHEDTWKEVLDMARTAARGPKLSLTPLVEAMKEDKNLENDVIKRLIKIIGMEKLVAHLSAKEKEQLRRKLES